jgi:hypothetical protein
MRPTLCAPFSLHYSARLFFPTLFVFREREATLAFIYRAIRERRDRSAPGAALISVGDVCLLGRIRYSAKGASFSRSAIMNKVGEFK